MSIVGRTSIAPCGHTGEVIIGTYVKCSQGCEGPAVVPKRGEVGHVENCACRPCQIRRKTYFIVLRDKGGKDWAKLDWDGATDKIKAKATKSGVLRHYHFLDAEGKVVGKGDLKFANVSIGDYTVHVKPMIDALVTCTVASTAIYQSLSDIVGITITVGNLGGNAGPHSGSVWTLPVGVVIP